MSLTRDDYVALKSPVTGSYPPSSPVLARHSHESDEDSLRALEILDGPVMIPRFGRYVLTPMTLVSENKTSKMLAGVVLTLDLALNFSMTSCVLRTRMSC